MLILILLSTIIRVNGIFMDPRVNVRGLKTVETMPIIGRSNEMDTLRRYDQSNRSELVAIYGRRRVGKTYLIDAVFEGRIDFKFTGLERTRAIVQRELFQHTLNSFSGKNETAPKNWFIAFERLQEYLLSLGKEKVIVFLDELPWMDTPQSDFLAALTTFWNGWKGEKVLLKLFVCGSATTWMLDKLIGDTGGLYGRISRPIHLSPFSLLETEQFLNTIKGFQYSRKQVLDTYMIFGGIPFYLDMLNGNLPLSVNVDQLLFEYDAPLRTEFNFLYRSLFKESVNHRRVVEALSSKLSGMTREEISTHTHMDGGELSRVLTNLEACDFIRTYLSPKKKERDKIYQLTDLFSLFHMRFVEKSSGQDPSFWTNLSNTGVQNSWAGYAFEQVCLHHLRQIRSRLGISGILSNAYAWSTKPKIDKDGIEWPGGQIDLIIDRSDQVMNCCEIKYSGEEYVIDKAYENTIRNRIGLFRREIKTKKDLRCTFITTYGVKANIHSGIVAHQLVMDDLFI